MKASIVIPAYNEEKCLARAINAALAQEYPDFEVIVVDNASTDNTAEIARSYGARITFVQEPQKGLLFAREAGRKIAAGDVIVQMDADCIPATGLVAKGMKHFENPKVVGLTGPYVFFDASASFQWTLLLLQNTFSRFGNFLAQIFGKGALLTGGNSFIRAASLAEIGGYDTTILFYGEDADTAKRLSKKGNIIFDPKLTMSTSARRFKALGTFQLVKIYFNNFISVMLASRPYNEGQTEHPR